MAKRGSAAPVLTFLPPFASAEERETVIIKGMDKPKVHLADNLVTPQADCPYGVEIWVKQGNEVQAANAP